MRRLETWLAGLAIGLSGVSTAVASDERPNVVILLADDLGFADLGFHGNRDIPTPNLDALAAAGVRCSNGYVSGPYCSPTRAGLLTGRYQQRFGHEFNPGGENNRDFGLPVDQTTLADRLKSAGYATGLVGKWHLGNSPEFRPRRRGFDEFYGFLGGAHSYFPGGNAPIFRDDEEVEAPPYLTDAFAREAVAFIDRHQKAPFLLYLAFNAVHTPMQADDARLAKFATIEDLTRRTYAAMLSALDDAVGDVVAKIREAGLEERTLFVFASDNGGPVMPGTSINGARNTPFRGSKRTTLEGGVHVPFVVSWKGHLPAGTVYDQPVIQLDLLPTALAAAGVDVDPTWGLDGVNLIPFLKGEQAGEPHESLYWRLGEQSAIRKGNWKLVRYDLNAELPAGSRPGGNRGLRVSPWKLYDLSKDPGESNDLSGAEKARFDDLLAEWKSWDAQLAAPLWLPAQNARQPAASGSN